MAAPVPVSVEIGWWAPLGSSMNALIATGTDWTITLVVESTLFAESLATAVP